MLKKSFALNIGVFYYLQLGGSGKGHKDRAGVYADPKRENENSVIFDP